METGNYDSCSASHRDILDKPMNLRQWLANADHRQGKKSLSSGPSGELRNFKGVM